MIKRIAGIIYICFGCDKQIRRGRKYNIDFKQRVYCERCAKLIDDKKMEV
jgi:predicted SprT family Zn-dependent metalloprotease